MAPELPTPDFLETPDDPTLLDLDPDADGSAGPSLPIILFSAASGIGAGIIAFYITHRLLLLNPPLSAGLATLSMLGTLGLTSGGLSVLIRANPLVNIGFSCGLLVLVVAFFGFCSLVGALAAALVLAFS